MEAALTGRDKVTFAQRERGHTFLEGSHLKADSVLVLPGKQATQEASELPQTRRLEPGCDLLLYEPTDPSLQQTGS